MHLKGLDDAGEDAGKVLTLEWGPAQERLATGKYVVCDAEGNTEPPKAVPEKKLLGELTRAELEALAAERGIDVAGARTKADVVAAIEAGPAEAGG